MCREFSVAIHSRSLSTVSLSLSLHFDKRELKIDNHFKYSTWKHSVALCAAHIQRSECIRLFECSDGFKRQITSHFQPKMEFIIKECMLIILIHFVYCHVNAFNTVDVITCFSSSHYFVEQVSLFHVSLSNEWEKLQYPNVDPKYRIALHWYWKIALNFLKSMNKSL